MKINGNKALAIAVIALTGIGLSACGSPDSASGGGGGNNGPVNGPTNYSQRAVTGKDVLGDGVLHVWPQEVADRVFFDTDKYTVKPEGRDLLGKWIVFLQSHPRDQLMIEGHSDERGPREYNLALGERRAASIKEFLVAGGIQAERIKTVSYGKERPAVLGSNEPAYAQNRRAVGVLQ